jgi:anion-transporting  ArsA/GET3 family ATPase
VLDKILGAELLGDARTFITALEAVFGDFRERADQTYQRLKEPGTAFVVVATPEQDALREAAYFVERLDSDGMPLAGLVVNRVTAVGAPWLTPERSAVGRERLEDEGDGGPSGELARDLLALHESIARRGAREERMLTTFATAQPQVAQVRVAALTTDVHDLEGLRQVGKRLSSR